MATEKQIKARKENYVRFYLLGVYAMIRRIKKESNFQPEYHMLFDQIIASVEVVLSPNVSSWGWSDALGTKSVQNMTEDHIRNSIEMLEKKMIFSLEKDRMLWLAIFRTEIIKRNLKKT